MCAREWVCVCARASEFRNRLTERQCGISASFIKLGTFVWTLLELEHLWNNSYRCTCLISFWSWELTKLPTHVHFYVIYYFYYLFILLVQLMTTQTKVEITKITCYFNLRYVSSIVAVSFLLFLNRYYITYLYNSLVTNSNFHVWAIFHTFSCHFRSPFKANKQNTKLWQFGWSEFTTWKNVFIDYYLLINLP